jgi:hypothetical protein
MENEFVPYEQALELKELGFNEPCLAHLIGFGDGTIENGRYKINQQQVFYPNDYISSDDISEELGLHPFGMCGVPLKQQVFRWFREKHNLFSEILLDRTTYPKFCFEIHKYEDFGNWEKIQNPDWCLYRKQEEAELDCIKKLIEIVKQKQ